MFNTLLFILIEQLGDLFDQWVNEKIPLITFFFYSQSIIFVNLFFMKNWFEG